MLTIKLNDETLTLPHNTTLEQVIREKGYSNTTFAIAINFKIIHKHQYTTTMLQDGDCVEIVTPAQGG